MQLVFAVFARCRPIGALLLAGAAVASCYAKAAAAQSATYEVRFQGNWTTASTPGGVAAGGYFTTLIGGVHGSGVTFWEEGGTASPGVENVAELGSTRRFRSEVQASPHTLSVIQQTISRGGRGSAAFTITVTRTHPLVTLLSMIGPSPDWFVGVSGVSLLDGADQWHDELVVDLYPYDAGTEDGTEFTLSNPATDPQGVITSLRGTGKFSDVRMARLTFTLQTSDPEASFRSARSSAGEGSGTRNVAVQLSPAPSTGLTLNYTLSGTATPGSDYTVSGAAGNSGTLAVSSGETSVTIGVAIEDDSADEGNETVVLTLTGGEGYTVGSPAAHTLTITDDDAPDPPPEAPTVHLGVSPNPVDEGESVTVTAELSQPLESGVTIPLTLVPGTAERSDYGSLESIGIGGGEIRGTGTITTAEDPDEDDETFTVALGTLPSKVRAGTPAQVTVRIRDDGGAVPPPNRPPTANADAAQTREDEPVEVDVLANDTDPEDDVLRVESVSEPSHGTARVTAAGSVEYRPAADYHGTDRFSYVVADPEGLTATGEVDVRVVPANDLPVAVGTIPEQTLEAGVAPVAVDLAGYFEDVDGDPLSFHATSSDTEVVGTAVAGSVVTVTPVAAGSAVVTARAQDPDGGAATQTFGVTVHPNPLERVVLEETLAAMARSQLASARMAVGRRVRGSGTGGEVRVMGRAVPLEKAEWWSELGGAAQGWLSRGRALLPEGADGPSGTGSLAGGGSELGEARSTGGGGLPGSWPDLASGLGFGGGSEALLGDTEFELAWGGQEAEGGRERWALWGEGDVQAFSGATAGAREYDGDVRTGYVGLDTELSEHWLVGTAVSRSRGDADWTAGAGGGRLTSTLTAVHPYVRWSGGSTSVWATAGGGWGELENEPERGERSESGLGLRLGLIELRQRVGSASGAEFALRADAGWAELNSEEGPGSTGGLRAAVHQQRLGAEVSRPMRIGRLVLDPFGETHLRRDGGAGQTGTGLEMAGGLRAVAGRLRIDAQGRLLAVHSAEGYEERGAGVTLSLGRRGGEGLALSMSSRWGGGAGGSGALWQSEHLDGRHVAGSRSEAWAMDARATYGMRLGRRLLSWFGAVGRATEGGRLSIGGHLGDGTN